MEIACLVCGLSAETMLGNEGYMIALPNCFTLRCPQISKEMMEEGCSGSCTQCKFMERAAERVFVNYLTRQ